MPPKSFFPFVSRRVHQPAIALAADAPVPVPRTPSSVQVIIRNSGAGAFAITYEATAAFADGIPVVVGEVVIDDYDGPLWLVRDPGIVGSATVIEGF
jgi:hypothetical protein